MSHARDNAVIDRQAWLMQRRELARLDQSSPLLIGASGHLLLSAAEEAQTSAQLLGRVLPQIAQTLRQRKVLLMTGAAPGADLVFSRAASDWFLRAGIDCSSVAVLPVPPDWLFHDWLQRAQTQAAPLSEAKRSGCREAMRRQLAGVQQQITLYDALSPELPMLARSPAWRDEQYRALAALLAEQADLLVAILRPQKLREPGGTAEVVQWRRHPQRIPPHLSTRDSYDPPRQDLIVIDPQAAFTQDCAAPPATTDEIADVLAQAQIAMHDGNDLRCYDLLARASRRGLRSPRMDYLRILALANVGGARLGLEHYQSLDLAADQIDEDWLALRGRLEKDIALAANPDRSRALFLRAAASYAEAFERWQGPYSGINAATMSLMAGRRDDALALASAVQARLDSSHPMTEPERFFRHVTAAEAALHRRDIAMCQAQLGLADDCCVGDVIRRSRTLLQLRSLCAALEIDAAILSPLRLPEVILLQIQVDGISVSPNHPAPANSAEIEAGTLVFMPLRDDRDLIVAEQVLQGGAHLYPTLACHARDAPAAWRALFGEALALRLQRVLDRAQRVAVVPGFLDDEVRWCAQQISCAALGASRLTARRLGCRWRTVHAAVDNGLLRCWPADAEPLLADPQGTGSRRMVGMLFADFAGYGRISDADMPGFWQQVMGAMSERLRQYGERVRFSATWGDALHVITVDATSAAQIAVDILRDLEQRRGSAAGVMSDLELRVAAHYAPAYEDVDPLRASRVFYGSQVSFAARIEPVTPPGTVFGSDAFVARLMLESPEQFSAEYAGELELAKKFGAHPLFAIHPRGNG